MKESLKSILGIIAIFAVGILVGSFLQPQPDYHKIDQLNNKIAGHLNEINQLNDQLTALYKENTNLLEFQEQINLKNKVLLKELKNASLTRKQKLERLDNYLIFIDKYIQRFHESAGTGNSQ